MATYGGLAFAAAFAAQGNEEVEYFVTNVVEPVVGGRDDPRAPAMKRLWHESQVNYTAEQKRKVEGADTTRKLATAERVVRLQSLRDMLPGMIIANDTEPSHLLVDKLVGMKEENVLSPLTWSHLTSRMQELEGSNKLSAKVWRTDPSGYVREQTQSVDFEANLSSDLLMERALLRRGYALHMADLMSFAVHQSIVNKYLDDLLREPLEGFSRVSWNQVQKADSLLWARLSDLSQGSLSRPSSGERPLDPLVQKLLHDPAIAFALIPTVASRPPAALHPGTSSGNKRPAPEAKSVNSKKGRGKSKGFDRGLPLPSGLRGLNARTPEGQRICYAYNLGKCTSSNCNKGQHVCAKCFGNHSYQDHRD